MKDEAMIAPVTPTDRARHRRSAARISGSRIATSIRYRPDKPPSCRRADNARKLGCEHRSRRTSTTVHPVWSPEEAEAGCPALRLDVRVLSPGIRRYRPTRSSAGRRRTRSAIRRERESTNGPHAGTAGTDPPERDSRGGSGQLVRRGGVDARRPGARQGAWPRTGKARAMSAGYAGNGSVSRSDEQPSCSMHASSVASTCVGPRTEMRVRYRREQRPHTRSSRARCGSAAARTRSRRSPRARRAARVGTGEPARSSSSTHPGAEDRARGRLRVDRRPCSGERDPSRPSRRHAVRGSGRKTSARTIAA